MVSFALKCVHIYTCKLFPFFLSFFLLCKHTCFIKAVMRANMTAHTALQRSELFLLVSRSHTSSCGVSICSSVLPSHTSHLSHRNKDQRSKDDSSTHQKHKVIKKWRQVTKVQSPNEFFTLWRLISQTFISPQGSKHSCKLNRFCCANS